MTEEKPTYSQLRRRISHLEKALDQSQITEAILQTKKKFLEAILDRLPVAIGLTQKRTMLWHNEAMTMMLHYHPEELCGKNVRMIYPDDQEYGRVTEALKKLNKMNEPMEIETKWITKDGHLLDILIHFVVFEAHPESPLILKIAQDITEKVRLSNDINHLAEAIHHSSDAVVVTDKAGNITYINPAFSHMTGFSYEEVIGQNPRFLKSGKQSDEFYRNLWKTISNGLTWKGQLVNKKKDGTLYTVDATISPVFSKQGKITAYVAVKRDITEKLRLERQLRQAQKLESIGLLASGIAHDFNNLLQAIYGYTQLLILERGSDAPDLDKLHTIERATQRAIDLVNQILIFSRKATPQKRVINLNHEIRLATKLLNRTIPKMINIKLQLSDNLLPIVADPIQVQQIVMNLCANARDAMPEGGEIVLKTRNELIDKGDSTLPPDAEPGRYVVLEISDSGTGIPREHMERIFDPFFTTKEKGKGTGLGLSVVYGIVKEHHGWIRCDSQLGKGTRFEIFLPVMEEDEDTSEVSEEQELPRGSETILIVDDETAVLDIGTYILRRMGYKVLQAKNGLEALRLFQENKEDISLVILDLIMPEMSGKECLKQILKLKPDAKVLISSGYTLDQSPSELLDLGACAILQKPYQMERLLRVVRKALDET